ncbi:MAG: hypothetical protein ACFNUJ_01970 [Campylobacter curvus]
MRSDSNLSRAVGRTHTKAGANSVCGMREKWQGRGDTRMLIAFSRK